MPQAFACRTRLIFNLPYRRIVFGKARDQFDASAFPKGWQSATLWYSAARRSRNQWSAGLWRLWPVVFGRRFAL